MGQEYTRNAAYCNVFTKEYPLKLSILLQKCSSWPDDIQHADVGPPSLSRSDIFTICWIELYHSILQLNWIFVLTFWKHAAVVLCFIFLSVDIFSLWKLNCILYACLCILYDRFFICFFQCICCTIHCCLYPQNMAYLLLLF